MPGAEALSHLERYRTIVNEAVVDAALHHFGTEQLHLLPTRIPGLVSSPGITHWNGQAYHESLRLAMRIWPHQNDSGGFFAAILEKGSNPPDVGGNAPAEVREELGPGAPVASEPWLNLLQHRFGIPPATFERLHFYQRGKNAIYLVAGDHKPPALTLPDAFGMRFMTIGMHYPKLTTAAAMAFSTRATRNIVDLERSQAEAYLARQAFAISGNRAKRCTGMGYVLVRYQEAVLGLAFYEPVDPGGGRIRSLYPRAWSPAAMKQHRQA